MNRLKKSLLLIAASAICALGLLGCKVKKDNGIYESNWHVESIMGEEASSPRGTLSLRISHSQGRVGGFAGCNSFSAALDKAAFAKGLFSVKAITSTRMACKDIFIEGTYFYALGEAKAYRVRGNKLYIYASEDLAKRNGEALIVCIPAPTEETSDDAQ